jgi:hypothetical protein
MIIRPRLSKSYLHKTGINTRTLWRKVAEINWLLNDQSVLPYFAAELTASERSFEAKNLKNITLT